VVSSRKPRPTRGIQPWAQKLIKGEYREVGLKGDVNRGGDQGFGTARWRKSWGVGKSPAEEGCCRKATQEFHSSVATDTKEGGGGDKDMAMGRLPTRPARRIKGE